MVGGWFLRRYNVYSRGTPRFRILIGVSYDTSTVRSVLMLDSILNLESLSQLDSLPIL